MDVSLQFAAAACNSVVNCFNWGKNNLVAYGAHHAVFIYDPTTCLVIHAMKGHKGRVNVVKWFHFGEYSWVVSGGSDGQLVIYRCTKEEYAVVSRVTLGKTSITAIATEFVKDDSALVFCVAVCSTDRIVRVLNVEIDDPGGKAAAVVLQDIPCVPRMMESVALCTEPLTKRTLLAMGGADTRVHIYVANGNRFTFLLQLAGHRDWVRSLDFAVADDGDVLLASSAQDNYVRLWRFTGSPDIVRSSSSPHSTVEDAVSTQYSSLSQRGQLYKLSPECDASHSTVFTAVLDAVLIGHDAWVLSVRWHPLVADTQPLKLLSASQDRAMMIWEPDRAMVGTTDVDASSGDGLGVWLPVVRMGDVGGNVLGFFRGEWSPCGSQVLGHGYHGSFHLWGQASEEADIPEGSASLIRWEPRVVLGGHYDAVVDLMWDPSSSYLMSTSADQTTRLWAEWVRRVDDAREPGPSDRSSWHEIARPQIHGYDQRCASFVRGRSHKFLAGAEEKVVRVFDAPATFVATLASISRREVADDQADSRSMGANVPPLGLSNRPIQECDVAREMDNVTSSATSFREELTVATPAELSEPAFEEFLLGSSLWPESQKLYGHGNELVSIMSSHDGRVVATSCKASKPAESAIILWDTSTWKKLQELVAHRLTVIRLMFSHDDKYLLSVSRDRALAVFVQEMAVEDDGAPCYRALDRVAKAHDRIIWDCSWTWDDRVFATASRDKKVKLWLIAGSGKCEILSTLPFCSPVTAVDWLPLKSASTSPDAYWLAVGLESGGISVHRVVLGADEAGDLEATWDDPVVFPTEICPVGSVKRLQWRGDAVATGGHQLAVCSSDHSVRIYLVPVPTPASW